MTGFKPDADALATRGLPVAVEADGAFAAAVVFVPRTKALARDLVARAVAAVGEGGTVIVDGAKLDGVETLLRACRDVACIGDVFSKAHGKCFALTAPASLDIWRVGPARVDGFLTAPGTFSAGGVDPGSAALADALPALAGRICDLGAGWGYLTARLLASDRVESVDVVEAEHAALACARANLSDPRVAFHWADATRWTGGPYDAVVTNPPFHIGRAADPDLGRAFVETAARVLDPAGRLHLVANRHLPYEAAFDRLFAQVVVRDAAGGYKVVEAARPRTERRRRR